MLCYVVLCHVMLYFVLLVHLSWVYVDFVEPQYFELNLIFCAAPTPPNVVAIPGNGLDYVDVNGNPVIGNLSFSFPP